MADQPVTPLALALWARQFATLVGAGVSLMRSLDLLRTTSSAPLAEITADLMGRVEQGATLSAAMQRHPDVFERAALLIVRAGEVGGVLDETLDRLARYLEGDVELRERLFLYRELARLRGAEAGTEVEERVRDALEGTRDRVTEGLFWRALGEMLSAGVPVVQAVECAAEVFEAEGAAAVVRVARGLLQHQPLTSELEHTGLFSPAPLHLCAIGEEVGLLDLLAQKAGELLELQTLATLREALAGSPLAPPAEDGPPLTAPSAPARR